MKALPYLAAALALSSSCLVGLRAKETAPPVPVSAATTPAPDSTAAPATEASAWEALQDATKPPLPPAEWNQKKPTDEEFEAFRLKMAEAAASAADQAKAFVTRFPDSTHAAEAKELRVQMLGAAVQLGLAGRAEELASLGGEKPGRRQEPKSSDPFEQKMQAAVTRAMQLQEKGMEAVLTEFEKGVREVIKEFPDRPETYGALLEVAQGVGGDKAREIAKEIAENDKAPEAIREQAAKLSKKYEQVGKPLELKFTAVDGREVSLASLKGKVVLVDFWATWCGPCVAELPKVKAAYEKLNPKGFEIIGISFDQEKDALLGFIKKKGMPWPQYFDGEGWNNQFGQRFGINSIPAMWLVDKTGVLRDLNAREDLEGKVEKMLAEN